MSSRAIARELVDASVSAPDRAAPATRARTGLRMVLVLGVLAAAAGAAPLGSPAALLASDPDLARLLRGIALVKGLFVFIGAGLVAWRFGRPLPTRFAALYLAEVWLAAAACVLIWQLTHIAMAAVAFHVAELAFLATAWRDLRSPATARPATVPPRAPGEAQLNCSSGSVTLPPPSAP